LYVGSLDSSPPTRIMSGVLRAQYAAGRLLFIRDGTLMAQDLDLKSFGLGGAPTPIAEQVASNAINGRTSFGASDRVLAYRNGRAAGSFVLAWFDRFGKRLETLGAPADYSQIRLAPDGKTLAANVGSTGLSDGDVWILDVTRGGIASRLTFTEDQLELGLAWSRDGRRLAFASGPDRNELYAKPASGVGDAELLFKSDKPLRALSWSPDGRYLAFSETNSTGVSRILLLPLAGDRKPAVFLENVLNAFDAVFSPDGRWIAYVSAKGGQPDVYIRPFPAGAREWRVSQAGGVSPEWRGDGNELFYVEQGARIMAVAISGGAVPAPASPVKLFSPLFMRGFPGFGQYSVAADGQRFLLIQPADLSQSGFGVASAPIVVDINWAGAR
jgi:dipeptidyl aminopeptidase/acylaminoacyl peptidase